MALLDVGYGASEGLQTVLANIRAEELLKQKQQEMQQNQQRIDETIRANKADEGLRYAGILGTAAERQAVLQGQHQLRDYSQATQRQGEYAMGQGVPRAEVNQNVGAGLSPTLYKEPAAPIPASGGLATNQTMSTLPMSGQPSLASIEQAPRIPLSAAPGPTPMASEASPVLTFTGTGKDQAAAKKEADAVAKADAQQQEQAKRDTYTERRLDQMDKALLMKGGDSGGAPAGEVTGARPPTEKANQINPKTGLTYGAEYQAGLTWALTGRTPPLGFGNSGRTQAKRETIVNTGTAIAQAAGVDVPTLQAEYRANEGALNKLLPVYNGMAAFETTANKNLALALQQSKQVGRSDSKLVNRYTQWAQGELTPAAGLTKFETYIYTAAREYAKVTSGAAMSSQGLSDSAQREAEKLLNAAQSPEAFQAAAEAMQQDMENAKNSYGEQISSISDVIGRAVGAPPPSGTGGGVLGLGAVQTWQRGPDGKLHKVGG